MSLRKRFVNFSFLINLHMLYRYRIFIYLSSYIWVLYQNFYKNFINSCMGFTKMKRWFLWYSSCRHSMYKDWTGASIDELFFYKSEINRHKLHDPSPEHKLNHQVVSHLVVSGNRYRNLISFSYVRVWMIGYKENVKQVQNYGL